MIINVHAGHNPDGKTACGAVGLIKESTEARKVKDEVVKMLKALGHTVYDTTCDNGKNQSDVLKQIVTKCNEHKVDVDVSIHFDSGAKDKAGNGKTTGTEVLVYNSSSKALGYANKVVSAISALGFKSRGVKYSSTLYFLKNTHSPAMLIECCFVDDKDDINLYNYQTMAKAIVKGITGQEVATQTATTTGNPYPVPTITLLRGSQGIYVKWLQWELKNRGYAVGSVDGDYGNKTYNAVKQFQKDNGLVADGIAGPKTISKLKYGH